MPMLLPYLPPLFDAFPTNHRWINRDVNCAVVPRNLNPRTTYCIHARMCSMFH